MKTSAAFRGLAAPDSFQFPYLANYHRLKPRRPVVTFAMAAIESASGSSPGQGVDVDMLIDSGADQTVIDRSLALSIGLKLPPRPDGKFGTAGKEEVPRWSTEALLQVFDRWILIPVWVREGGGMPLLGRRGVFDRNAFTILDGAGFVLGRQS